jgi:HTH-type transcriptional regulator/antitoxin HigA
VNGAARWLSGDKAVIQLSLYGVKADKFWFSLFHEIGHIFLHGKRFSSVDLDGSKSLSNVIEAEADEYSRNVLIPFGNYKDFVRANDFSESAITLFARGVAVLPGVVVGRLQYEGKIPFNKGNHLKNGYVWAKGQL